MHAAPAHRIEDFVLLASLLTAVRRLLNENDNYELGDRMWHFQAADAGAHIWPPLRAQLLEAMRFSACVCLALSCSSKVLMVLVPVAAVCFGVRSGPSIFVEGFTSAGGRHRPPLVRLPAATPVAGEASAAATGSGIRIGPEEAVRPGGILPALSINPLLHPYNVEFPVWAMTF